MKIVDKPIEWLRPYENNPRNNEQAVEAVANSIKEFGFKVPIVATPDGEIVNGHTRFKAAKFLKLKTVPVLIADDLTEEQIKAFRLADNKTGELADWDIELLSMKPLKLIARCVLNSSKKGDKILDSFNGGGSTLMVCERSERVCYAMELDPVYVERTIKRWEEETGLTAEKVS